MRSASLVLLALALLVPGCFSSSYNDDAGTDAGTTQMQTFDVDNSGSAICPGDLYNAASNGTALCSHPPETCFSAAPDAAINRIECTCSASGDAGSGRWTCFQAP